MITGVTHHCIARRSGSGGACVPNYCRRPSAQWLGWYWGTWHVPTASYTEFTHTWNVNPDTGNPWTELELQTSSVFGVWLWSSAASGGSSRCTQLWIVVHHDDGPDVRYDPWGDAASQQNWRDTEGWIEAGVNYLKMLTNDGDTSYVWYTTSGGIPFFPGAGYTFRSYFEQSVPLPRTDDPTEDTNTAARLHGAMVWTPGAWVGNISPYSPAFLNCSWSFEYGRGAFTHETPITPITLTWAANRLFPDTVPIIFDHYLSGLPPGLYQYRTKLVDARSNIYYGDIKFFGSVLTGAGNPIASKLVNAGYI